MPCKGILESPFQLIILVFLLTFVMAIGLKVMADTEEARCHLRNKNEMIKLKQAIERIAGAPVGTSDVLEMNPEICAQMKTFDISIVSMAREACFDCEGAPSICYKVIERVYPPRMLEPTVYQDICINVEPGTVIRNGGTTQIDSNILSCEPVIVPSVKGGTRGIWRPSIVKIVNRADGVEICSISKVVARGALSDEST